MFKIISGTLYERTNKGPCRVNWTRSDRTPEVGTMIEYWRCGDDNSLYLTVPEVGGEVVLRDSSEWTRRTPEFTLGTARFVRVVVDRFMQDTAVGSVPSSRTVYRRVS